MIWGFGSGVGLELDCTDFEGLEGCFVGRVCQIICNLGDAGGAGAGEEVAVLKLGAAELGGVCGVNVGDCELGVCGDGGEGAEG